MFMEYWNHVRVGAKREDEAGDVYMIAPCLHGPIRNQRNPLPLECTRGLYEDPDSPPPAPIPPGYKKRVDIINTEWCFEPDDDEWYCCLGGPNPAYISVPLRGSAQRVGDEWRDQCPFRQACRMTSTEAREKGLL
jgi:hypothetical protein